VCPGVFGGVAAHPATLGFAGFTLRYNGPDRRSSAYRGDLH
jgi:hypothetical protein